MHKYIVMSLTQLQENSQDSSVTLSQRAYIISDSLQGTSKAVFGTFILLLFFLLFVLLSLFVPGYQTFFDPLHTTLQFVRFWIPCTIILVSALMIWYYQRARKVFRMVSDWNHDYLTQAYILTFDTTLPTGNTTGEKVYSLAKLIFPELRFDYAKFSPYYTDYFKYYFKKKIGKSKQQSLSRSLNYSINGNSFDLALRTMKGYFIVKDFKNKAVTEKDLRETLHVIRNNFKDKYHRSFVLRVVFVAKEYAQPLLERETLENKMTREIRTNFGVDLLIQDNAGYSVLWVG